MSEHLLYIWTNINMYIKSNHIYAICHSTFCVCVTETWKCTINNVFVLCQNSGKRKKNIYIYHINSHLVMQEKKTPVSSDLFYRWPAEVDRGTSTEHIPRIKNKAYTNQFKTVSEYRSKIYSIKATNNLFFFLNSPISKRSQFTPGRFLLEPFPHALLLSSYLPLSAL